MVIVSFYSLRSKSGVIIAYRGDKTILFKRDQGTMSISITIKKQRGECQAFTPLMLKNGRVGGKTILISLYLLLMWLTFSMHQASGSIRLLT